MTNIDFTKVLRLENVTEKEYLAACKTHGKYGDIFAIVENNTGRYLLVTDEPADGALYAAQLNLAGITNWHTLQTQEDGSTTREESDDFDPKRFGFV